MPVRIKIALALIIIFSSYLIFFEKKFDSTNEKLLKQNQLVSFSRGDLFEVSFGDITLEKQNDSYRVKKPVSHPASKEKCEKIFRQFEKVTAFTKIEDENALKNFQKAKIRKKVHLKGKDFSKTLILGPPVKNTTLKECYAKSDDSNDVFIVQEEIFEVLNHPVNYYMDLQPFAYLEKGQAQVIWSHGENLFSLKRIDDNFIISENNRLTWSGDSKKCAKFLEILSKLDFIETPYTKEPKETESDDMVKVLVVGEVDKNELKFSGKLKGENACYLQFEKGGLFFKVPLKLSHLFKMDFNSLIANNIFEGAVTALKEVRMIIPEEKNNYVFMGNDTDWNLDHPYGWLFSSGKILNFILKISIQDVYDFQERKLSNPFLSLKFNYSDPEVSGETVNLFKDKDTGEILVQKTWTKTSAKIKGDFFKEFEFDPFIFTHSYPFQKIIKKSKKLIIKNNEKVYKLIKSEFGKWSLDSSFAQEIVDVPHLMTSLLSSKTFSSMKRKAGIDFGFNEPLWEMSFSDKDSDFLFQMKLGSYSNEKEAFLLCNDEIFLFFKKFFLSVDKKIKTIDIMGGKNANV